MTLMNQGNKRISPAPGSTIWIKKSNVGFFSIHTCDLLDYYNKESGCSEAKYDIPS
jgi:hypothetical protein